MRKIYLGLTVILLLLVWSIPVFAVVIEPNQPAQESQVTQPAQEPQATQQVQTTPNSQPVQQVTTQSTGGVKPISPEKVQSKVDAMENWAVALMAPIIHLMSKLSLIIAVLLIIVAVFAKRLFGRAFMIIGCVILAMVIFTNVGAITDSIQWMGQWLGQ